ncbi:hypothetical protein [Nannocystis pusilla]|uniref:hypothetical protein n=1 Tax=Nannocystis pusilla TaxID=889268 RepID=UPI003B7942C6
MDRYRRGRGLSGSLTRQPGIGWTAGAASVQTIPAGDGYVRFSSQEANLHKMAGLGHDTDHAYTDIEYAYYLRDDGLVEIFEQGASRGLVGVHTPGDMFQIEVHGQQVRYRKNGRVIHTSAFTPAYPLVLDTSLYHAGATIREAELVACVSEDDADCLPAEAWQGVRYAEASEQAGVLRLERVPLSGIGWNAGASSVEHLDDGAGFLCLYPERTDRHVMAGLGRDDDDPSYTDIDYAVYLRDDGRLEIYEYGASQGFDHLRQRRRDLRPGARGAGPVRQERRGDPHQFDAAPASLAFDTSLYSPGAAITGVLVPCAAGDLGCIDEGAWRNVRYTEASGDALRRISGVGWNAGAASVAVIGEGDGYVAFTTEENHLAKMAGLAHADDDPSYTDIDYAFYMRGDGWLEIFEHGSSRGVVGTYAPGDQLRVEVQGEQVRWRKNGVVLLTRQGAPDYPLALDTSLLQSGATITGAQVRSCGVGDLECMPEGVWRNVYYATADDGLLTRTPGTGWNAGASSQKTLTSDGYVLFGTHELGLAKMAGLDHSDDNQSYTDIDYAFYLRGDGLLEIYEKGHSQGLFGTYDADDLFSVEVSGLQVRYRKNWVLIHTSTTPADYPLALDASLLQAGATVVHHDVHACGASDEGCIPPEMWKNVRYAAAEDDTLTRVPMTGTAWNAGASSVAAITMGDGFVQFSTDEVNRGKMAGLGRNDDNQSYTDIDYAFYLRADGLLDIYEHGAHRPRPAPTRPATCSASRSRTASSTTRTTAPWSTPAPRRRCIRSASTPASCRRARRSPRRSSRAGVYKMQPAARERLARRGPGLTSRRTATSRGGGS